MQVGHLATNTGEIRRLILPMTKIKVEGTELTALVYTGASANFLQMHSSKLNTVVVYTSNNAYQVRIAMG